VSWQAYTVKRSDKPEQIAARNGMTLAELKAVNGIDGKKKIVAGQTLMVPLNGSAEPHLPDLPAPKVTLARYRPKGRCVQVKNGVRKVVQCRAPAKKVPVSKKPASKNQPPKRVNVTLQTRS
jgi:hypothetical protein